MAIRAELTITGGKTFKVARFYTTIKRKEDNKGRPTTEPSWRMFLLLESTSDATITNWMCDPTSRENGKVTFYKVGEESKLKEIEFRAAYCFKMRDFFNASFTFSSTFIGISGKGILIDSVELEQDWSS